MSDRVLIPLPGIGTLTLSAEQYEAALAAGAHTAATTVGGGEEPLMDAETLAKVLSLPQSWIEQRTREGELPCYRAGRWIRYRRSEIESILHSQGKRS